MVAFQSVGWQVRRVPPNAVPRVGPPCKSRVSRPVYAERCFASPAKPQRTTLTPSSTSSSSPPLPFGFMRRNLFQMDRTVSCEAQKQENQVQDAATPKSLEGSSQTGKGNSHPPKDMLIGEKLRLARCSLENSVKCRE